MKTCFVCKQVIITITEDFIGDVRCPHCKVLNSFYDPKDFVPEEEKKQQTTEKQWLSEEPAESGNQFGNQFKEKESDIFPESII